MPAEAAAEATAPTIESNAPEQSAPQPRKSLFGGLSRALGRKEAKETVAAEPVEPDLSGDPVAEPTVPQPLDPKVANRPLDPGSGAPDLNAIMRRVREERNQSSKPGHSDAARQDFLAAARRHAQAAAAEAAIGGKSGNDVAGPRRLGFGSFLRRYRKPALMAATGLLVVLAGAKLGQDYLDGEDEVAATAPTPLASGQHADSADAADPVVTQPTARGLVAASVTGTQTDDEPSTTGSITGADETSAASNGPGAEVDQSLAVRMAGQPATQTASLVPPVHGSPATTNSDRIEQIGPAALRDAATAGDAKAMFEVGARFAEGRGVKVDMAQAAAWYEKSAELGFALAQYRVGNLYEKATGVQRDIAKAKMWYQESAEQGNASAMHNLAVLYAMGADGSTDNAMALRWFGQAAELGVKDSQFNLGILAAKGIGMPQNLVQSYKWFAIAAKTGDADAARKRDELAKSLQPDQLEAASAEVDAWKAKQLDPKTNSVEIPESWQDAPTMTAAVDMTKAVRNIQAILIKNGYDAGNTDGVMGEQTKDAIKAFQTDNKMEPTGEVDEKLVRALLDRK
jgi:localization factor PodJL